LKRNNNNLIIIDDNNNKRSNPIIIPKIDSNLQLSSQLSSSPSTNITNEKDERLELVEIPKGLIEILQDAGFTIEKILDGEPSHIAEILGIYSYVGEIIYKETSKAISNTNPNLLIN
jgi:hypothetical protein